VFDAVSLGCDSVLAYEYISETALEVATPPLAWKRARNFLPYNKR